MKTPTLPYSLQTTRPIRRVLQLLNVQPAESTTDAGATPIQNRMSKTHRIDPAIAVARFGSARGSRLSPISFAARRLPGVTAGPTEDRYRVGGRRSEPAGRSVMRAPIFRPYSFLSTSRSKCFVRDFHVDEPAPLRRDSSSQITLPRRTMPALRRHDVKHLSHV